MVPFSADHPDVVQFCLCQTRCACRADKILVAPWQEGPEILRSR